MSADVEKRPQRVTPVARNNDAFTSDLAQEVVARLRNPTYMPDADPVVAIEAFEFLVEQIGVSVVAGGQRRDVFWSLRSRQYSPGNQPTVGTQFAAIWRRNFIARIRRPTSQWRNPGDFRKWTACRLGWCAASLTPDETLGPAAGSSILHSHTSAGFYEQRGPFCSTEKYTRADARWCSFARRCAAPNWRRQISRTGVSHALREGGSATGIHNFSACRETGLCRR